MSSRHTITNRTWSIPLARTGRNLELRANPHDVIGVQLVTYTDFGALVKGSQSALAALKAAPNRGQVSEWSRGRTGPLRGSLIQLVTPRGMP
jgi:hypothetical protein